MIIYKLTNTVNGKAYVGQTIQAFKKRIGQHRNNRKSFIGQAIRKYGWENFKAEILEECSSYEELDEREKYWIAFFNTMVPNGYNLTEGSNHCTSSKDTRQKQSEAAKRRFQNQAERDKISATLVGRKDSDEVKAHKSAGQRKRYADNPAACQVQSEGLRRRFSNPAEREKQSESMKRYAQTPEGRNHLLSASQKAKVARAEKRLNKLNQQSSKEENHG